MEIEEKIKNSIVNALKDLNYPVVDINLEEPPSKDLGDLSTNLSFKLASDLGMNPVDIANNIVNAMETPKYISKVETKGPYINFFIDYDAFAPKLLKKIDENYGNLKSKNKKVILEHTSANPNGPLHVGHLRNAIIGDSLARIMRAAGYDVETHYYVNDMGRQVAMVVWGALNLEFKKEKVKKDHEIGKIYYLANKALENDPKIENEVNKLMKKYEEGDKKTRKIFKNIVKKCLEGIKETLKNLNIEHDKFVWESDFVRDSSIEKIIEKLKNTEYFYESEGAICLNLEKFGIEKELILKRSDGTSLYATRDIAYHFMKSQNADIVIDVLGSDHKLTAEQVKTVMKILKSKQPEIIFYEFITLPNGSMSTRKGTFVSVDELIEESKKRAIEEIKKRRKDISESEMEKIAEIVSIGAIRYYIAKLSPEKHLTFKWEDVLDFEKGCASIQYAHARACKLLKKAKYKEKEYEIDKWPLNDLEIDLIRILSKFPKIVETAAKTRKIHMAAQYAQELANAFNRFYKHVPVIGSEHEKNRLVLVEKCKITINNCLKLLGIKAPSSM
ncbi:arginyl-tRNA synthetase [Methanothermus fervidus DSM 2088]|uniref:Arginine--tRNA ligase n=1 Tax=Methanothermus fervidus (strain ATCC 43054 / DSM 2088 / JCM 10308 / V24 S) TaxID=523846 RepID=E3GWZ5_METFV|nr:arginyl-tRNA synthetase [Methanothermus fervidus DSM 2088]